MRATIRNYMDAVKRREEGDDEAGFSLVELIVVVVILGILAAVAIPIFTGIQATAEKNAADAASANAASQAAAGLAQNPQVSPPTTLGDYNITYKGGTTPTKVEQVCATATHKTNTAVVGKATGPGC